MAAVLLTALALASVAQAAPAPSATVPFATDANTRHARAAGNDVTHGAVTPMSADEVNSWQEPVHYASAVYCGPDQVKAWKCGQDCEKLGNVTVVEYGGDNSATPWWYVAHDGKQIIVTVAGTNLEDLLSVWNDVNFVPRDVEAQYMPDAGGVEVHRGFYGAFSRIVDDAANAVLRVESGPKDILVVGHSLGAAVAELLAVHFTKRWPERKVTSRIISPPRVGTPAWANYADKVLGDNHRHLINYFDIVPHLPTLDMGFRHPTGEVFVNESGSSEWVFCEGQENDECNMSFDNTIDSVNDVVAHFADRLHDKVHSGPFFGQLLGSTCVQPRANAVGSHMSMPSPPVRE